MDRMMNLYTIALRFEESVHDGSELTRVVEGLPGQVSILAGHNKDVITAEMDVVAATAARRILFAEVEQCSANSAMNLLC
jgi:hypothetical protein